MKKIISIFLFSFLFVVGFVCFGFTKMTQAKADVYTKTEEINGEYSDDTVIVTLKPEYSIYRGVNKEISDKFLELNVKSITNLTEFSEIYVDENNILDKDKAPDLYAHYQGVDFHQGLLLKLKETGKEQVKELIYILNEFYEVAEVYPDYIDSGDGSVTPNDTYISYQWALNSISAYDAWQITTGNPNIRIGVMDSGISSHTDLNDNVVGGYDFYNDNSIFTDDIGGHGTHVAGIIGAKGNNGKGITGIAQDIGLYSLQTAYDTSGSGHHYLSERIEAIQAATQLWQNENERISAINMSIGSFGVTTGLLSYIQNYPGLFVWSAGNDGLCVDDYTNISSFNLSNLISVGAINSDGNRRESSNYGVYVSIYAPGQSIYSTLPSNTYGNMSGTSMAAPHVTGVAALMLSVNPNLTAAQLKTLILNNSDTISISVPDGLGGTTNQNVNKLNAYKSVAAALYEVNSTGQITGLKTGTTFSGVISIPSSINGNAITGIADGAFINNSNITSVILPNTITSIGANAFENCTNLTSVSGLNNIVSIGAQAFKGCSSLTNISIPAGTTSIGAGAFAGCSNLNISVSSSNPNYSASGNILYNKTGTVINSACNISDTITIPSTVTEISPYAFYDNDNLETLHIYGVPTIGLSAFENCENLTDVYCYSYTVPTLGLNAFSNDTFTLYTPHSKQSQYVTAFAGYVNTASSIPVTISFSSDGTVIDTLNTYFGANITGLTNPSKTGYNFAGWYDNIAYIGTVYTNGGLWDTTSNLIVYAKWSPQTYYIYFTGYGSENLADKEVTYDAPIGTMPSVSRTGYTFYGWKNQYNEYFTSDMIWQKLSNQTVSSDLRANQYTITYNGNGGTANAQSQSVYYDGVISSFASAYREGYAFTGWNTSANGSGQTFTAPYTYVIDDDTILYAQYTANEYNVTFDKQGGTGGSDGVNAIYNSPMPSGTNIIAPTKNGYTFLGYYRYAGGLGTKYYNADMTSANIWNLSDDTTLFAYWSANQYTVTLDQQSGAGGTNSVNATYNAAMPSGANIIAPTRTGYTFQGYFQHVNGGGTKYYYSDMTSNNVWNVAGNSTIYAYWTPNTYTISLQLEGGTNGSTIVQATYNSPMNSATAPTRIGYTFQGYYSSTNGFGTKYYNSDMSSAHVWDIADNGTLYAYWLGDQFTVTFNKQGGSGGTTNTNVVYGSAMPAGLSAPTKSLHIFMGYYDSVSGGTMYYDGNMASAHNWDKLTNATLYAHWRGVYFNITYSNLTFLNQTADVLLDNDIGNYAPTYYEYGVGLDLTRVSAFYQSSSPYSPQLRFLGWYTSMSFSTQKTSISQSSIGNVTIYAKWRYDYDNPSRIGTYTITDAGEFNQGSYYDTNYIGLAANSKQLYNQLSAIGINYLTIKFKIRLWEVSDGYQEIYFYGGSESTNLLWYITNHEHDPDGTDTTPRVYTLNVNISLSSLQNINEIYIRYSAHGKGSDTWKNDLIYYELSYTVNQNDINYPTFYWAYQDPFS